MSELTEGNQGCGLIEVENTLDGTKTEIKHRNRMRGHVRGSQVAGSRDYTEKQKERIGWLGLQSLYKEVGTKFLPVGSCRFTS